MHQNSPADCVKDATKKDIQIQSLHIFGECDASVPKHIGEDSVECFVKEEMYIHEKGHFISQN